MRHLLYNISKTITIIFLLISVSTLSLYAQNSNINKAKSNLKKGNHTAALEYIDLATQHKKTKEKPETYLTKSNVLQKMMFIRDSTNQNIDDKYFDDWKMSVKKVIELSKDDDKYKFFLNNSKAQLSNNYFNIGVMAYQKKKNDGAYNLFKRAYDINNENISALQNAATIGIEIEKYKDTEPLYEILITQDSVDVNNVFRYVNVLAYKQKKYEKALKVIERMLPKFPTNKDLQEQEVNMYVKLDKLEEAKNKLEKKIKQDANPDPQQYIRLGQFYEHLKNDEKKLESFKTAFSLDNKNVVVLQNLGVHYYNKAVSIKNSVGKLSDSEYAKKGASLLKQADKQFVKAAEYFEVLVSIDNKDKETLEHLVNIYKILKKKDKVKATEEKLKKI